MNQILKCRFPRFWRAPLHRRGMKCLPIGENRMAAPLARNGRYLEARLQATKTCGGPYLPLRVQQLCFAKSLLLLCVPLTAGR